MGLSPSLGSGGSQEKLREVAVRSVTTKLRGGPGPGGRDQTKMQCTYMNSKEVST